jgi:hypothetical protein
MPQRKIGEYPLGFIIVECWVDDLDSGGAFSLQPTPADKPRIVIGTQSLNKTQVLISLIHEALEFQFSQQDFRYIKDSKQDNDPGNYLFQFDHVQFQETLNRVVPFVEKFWPLLFQEVDQLKRGGDSPMKKEKMEKGDKFGKFDKFKKKMKGKKDK